MIGSMGTNKFKLLGAALGFMALAVAAAYLLSSWVYHYGIVISPKFLTWIALLGLMIAMGVTYITPLHGLIFNNIIAKPTISLSANLLGLCATEYDYVCHTVQGYRCFFSLSLPFAELAETTTTVKQALAPLVSGNIPFSVYLYETPAPAPLFVLDGMVESELRSLLEAENRRLEKRAGKGVVTLVVSARIGRMEDADTLLAEIGMRSVKPFPWRRLADGFFPPSLFDGSGVIAPSRAFSVPATVENDAGRFLPVMLHDFREDYRAPPAHTRLQELAHHLGVPVLWQVTFDPFNRVALRRLRQLNTVQKAWPPGLLSFRQRADRAEAPNALRKLEAALEGADKPAIMFQVVWLPVGDEDHRVLFRRARQYFAGQDIGIRGTTPSGALKLYLGLHPGGESARLSVAGARPQLPENGEFFAEVNAMGNWVGHPSPTVILEDDEGKAFPFGIFGDGTNFNLALVGESGSGKSVFLAGLVAGHLAQSRYNRAIIVDYGGSFDGLVQALRGRQISHDDLHALKFSPIPAFQARLSEAAFAARYPGQDHGDYTADQDMLETELMKQSLALLAYICDAPDGPVFREHYLHFLRDIAVGKSLSEALEAGIEDATGKARTSEGKVAETWTALANFLTELRAAVGISPYLGDDQVDLAQERLVSFNLDGFAEDDRRTLVGLITLLINRTFGEPSTGKTLIVFDEAHAYLKGHDAITEGLGKLLASAQRVTRKHGASLLIATQSPADFEAHPALLENANHQIIMRLAGKADATQWRITKADLLQAAREAEPARTVGYSQIHLATGTRHGTVQKRLRYRLHPAGFYLFTSEKQAKLMLRLACHLTGTPNFVALGLALHPLSQASLIPIGSRAFWVGLLPFLLDAYEPLKPCLARLMKDPERAPLLDLFLNKPREFERVATDPGELLALEVGDEG